ncbi:LuxR family transcriptional regulator [Nocardioides sp. J54]|nr:LuxR family transcriptional regulator [Nocardioides sp. J54]
MGRRADVAFVGRDAELATWQRLAAGAEAGAASAWVVDGAPGVGKTALLDRVRADARSRGWRVLSAVGNPLAHDMDTLSVCADWFDQLLVEREPGRAPFDGPGVLVRRALTEGRAGIESADLVRSITWALRSLAEEGPLLVVLDDAHWVNTASVGRAAGAAAVITDERIVFVFVHRADERPGALEPLLARPHAVATTLGALDADAVDEWLCEVGRTPDPQALREVLAVTGGLPLLVRHVLADPMSGVHPRTAVDAAATRGVAARRVAAQPGAADVLAALTLLDEHADLDAVAEVLGLEVAEARDRLAALAEADLVQPVGGAWQATHPTIAEVGLEVADPAPIAARVVALLRTRAVRPYRLATLVLRTRPGTVPAGAAILLQAAEDLVAGGGGEECLELLDRAGIEGGLPDDGPLRVATARGRALASLGRIDDAARALTDALELAPPAELAVRHADLGDTWLGAGAVAEANAAYGRALDLLSGPTPELTSSERRGLIARLAGVASLSGRVGEMSQAELAAILAQPEERDTYGDRALLAMAALGMTIVGEDAATAGRLAARAAGDLRVVEQDGVHGGVVSLLTGALNATEQDDLALDVIDAAQALARRRGSITSYATLAYTRAAIHHNRGELRRCEAEAMAALDLREDGWTLYLEAAQFMAVWALLAQGRREEAGAVVREVDVDSPRGPLHAAMARVVRGMAALDVDDPEAALADLLVARDLSAEFTGPSVGWFVRYAVQAAARAGRSELARTMAVEAVDRARHYGAPRLLGVTLRSVSEALEPAERAAHLDEAVRLLRGSTSWFELALAHRDRAELRAGRSDTRAALEDARRCLELAERIGAAPVSARIRERIRDWGGDDAAGPLLPPESVLTTAEYRVAELAAAGLTNREIAERLFVIVKTVEWHLSRAYKKLGVSSRRELAAVLATDR